MPEVWNFPMRRDSPPSYIDSVNRIIWAETERWIAEQQRLYPEHFLEEKDSDAW